MESFFSLKSELREQFYSLVKSRASEERFIEFISSTLQKSNKFHVKALDVILDLTVVVADRTSDTDCCNYSSSVDAERSNDTQVEQRVPEPVTYDADDEGLEESYIFPCQVTFDDCHPELLHNYHGEHIKATKTSSQIIKYPRLLEFMVEFMFNSLKTQLEASRRSVSESVTKSPVKKINSPILSTDVFFSESIPVPKPIKHHESLEESINVPNDEFDRYLDSANSIVRKLTKICHNEKKNCRTLARTRVLDFILENIVHLLQLVPDKQHLYLDSLLKLAFTLADYKISSDNLNHLFRIIKDKNADLNIVLADFERLLNHHHRVSRNIQPLKSINFPTASKTAGEIEANSYVANSWHWRLRSKVIEFKRKRSRTQSDSQREATKESAGGQVTATETIIKSTSPSDPISPSWLECSLIVPLSNISPLIHDGQIKLCCSMWMSVCGDLLVIEQSRRAKKVSDDFVSVGPDRGSASNWYWVRLTSGKRAARRYKDKFSNRKSVKSKIKLTRRQAHDKEDDDRDEAEDKVRRSELEEELASYSGYNGFRLFSSTTNQIRTRHLRQRQKKLTQKPATIPTRPDQGDNKQSPPKEFLGRRARDNSQKVLMHLVSFAIDTLTIEIWLNVKCMTFCARACRVAREGQTNLLDQVTFPSHLEADGSWSNVVFCLEEVNKTGGLHEKVMNLKVIVNGVHKEKEKLSYNNHKNLPNNFACLLGCERSTYGYVWKLSQINVYKNTVPKDMPMYLLGKGPDFWSFTNFGQHSSLILPDIVQRNVKCLLDPKLLNQYNTVNEERALNWLTQNIVVTHVAHQPDYFLDYSSLMNPSSASENEFSNSAERFIQARVLNFARTFKTNTNHGFGSALVGAGGIEGVLVCFADVIRRSQDSANTHSLAFSALLKLSQSNPYHLNKFLDELNGLKLTEFILVHPNCLVSKQMLEHYLDFCLAKKGEHSLIKSPALIYHLMSCWRAWHKDVLVARSLYKRLIRLIQPTESIGRIRTEDRKLEDYYIKHNFKMMTAAGGIDILMNTLRECLVPLDQSAPKINHELVELIVNLISLLIKHPPGLDIIMDIMEFLLFLHPDPKAYVEAVTDKTSFLYEILREPDNANYSYDPRAKNVRTPLSETSSSYRISCENVDDQQSDNEGPDLEQRDLFSRTTVRSSSNDDIFGSVEQPGDEMSRNFSEENLTQMVNRYNLTTRRDARKIGKFSWINDEICNEQEFDRAAMNPQHAIGLSALGLGRKCSNRNFAIAHIANMLASIVKLTLTDPSKILSEVLQKHIIDARKLVILANNNSSFVREKVLRLFLYCIRACYSLNLKSILNKYDHEFKGSSVKLCSPIQLMARQLLKYPTTIKMIQLCYGIIVGIDDFETADTFCLTFDIDTINNGLQLNTLILLVQLMTRLQEPSDIILAVKFVHAYMRQLMKLDEDESIKVLVENNLVESLMRIYFAYLEHEIARANDEPDVCRFHDGDAVKCSSEYEQVRDELDRTLIVIVRYFIQNLTTAETIKNISNLLTYFDLINTYVPADFKSVMRDRKVLVLITAIRYLQHYEESARRKSCGGKMEYYLKSLFKNDNLNTFINALPDDRFELGTMLDERNTNLTNDNDEPIDCPRILDVITEDELGEESQLQNGHDSRRDEQATNSITDSFDDLRYINDFTETRKISSSSVIDRFKSTLEFTINFITFREPGVIPSPLERRFIINCIKMLSCYLQDLISLPQKDTKCHWSLILPKLDRTLRLSFSRVILYLLSPCESLNLDERKYFAAKLLDLFDIDYLLTLLDDNASGQTNYRVLAMFIRDLVDRDNTEQCNSEDSNCEQDGGEVLSDEIENQLRLLMRKIELSLVNRNESHYSDTRKQKLALKISDGFSGGHSHKVSDAKFVEIWMSDLKQMQDDLRDRVALFKIELQMQDGLGGNDGANDGTNKMLDEALQVTRDVVNDKHKQRKAYLEDLKQNKMYNYHIRQQWLSLIIGHTHERTTWFMSDYYPTSWELNPVEGPSRTRRRLRPCKLMLEVRYIRKQRQSKYSSLCQGARSLQFGDKSSHDLPTDDWHNIYSPHPLCSMIINHEQSMDSNELRTRMFTTDKIHFNCDCSIVRPNEVCDGEVSIASWCIHFIGERSNNYQQHLNNHPALSRIQQQVAETNASRPNGLGTSQSFSQHQNSLSSTIVEDLWFDEIVEIWDRRYQLQDVGLEIFLTNNMTYLLSFRTNQDREDFKQNLMREQSKMFNFQRFNQNTSLARITQFWRDGRLTNFDFLTYLNKLAGRSFNDLMQYPVFPFVLANYTTPILDLNVPANFRDLKRPMAVQNPEREATFLNNYKDSQSTNLSLGFLGGMKQPYHYGNHYSNSATVLHFLVRLPPFTQMHVQYQDNNFDQPDRIFHSIANTWQLITRDSNTDFKELIPEFFFLPEMFKNFEHFDLGIKQNNEMVDDVKLPPWCPNSDARLFTLIHRQALESKYVTENLNHWIDLIFGYKQTGKAALDAMNVFHPATYYGVINDLIGQQQSSVTNSTTQISSTIASLSAKSSTYSSDYVSTIDINTAQLTTATGSQYLTESGTPTLGSRRQLVKRQQADIERLALETMIRTYGQMPRQLYAQPIAPRLPHSSSHQFPETVSHSETAHLIRMEPLKQVKGLRWGSYVGSPDEADVAVVRHKRIASSEPASTSARNSRLMRYQSVNSRPTIRYNFCLLPNGEIAILKDNTSLMLNYSADRKSGGGGYHLYTAPARYIKRAGLRSVARMNLFSNMIISRQQFNYIEPINSIRGNLDAANTNSATSLFTNSRSSDSFSPKSLSLISWFYLDGTIRVRHRAQVAQKPTIPLVQADSIVDQMSTCTTVPELNLLLVGYKSGAICAHIVSTSQKIVPILQYDEASPSSASTQAQKSVSAAPSAVHFLHATSDSTSPSGMNSVAAAGAKSSKNSPTDETYSAISLAGRTLQSVPLVNKTTRWLYCHEKRINCMRINVNFGIVVTGSDDGTSVIWDLNSLTYVKTIDYKVQQYKFGAREDRSGLRQMHFDSNDLNNDHDRVSDYLCNCDNSPKSEQHPGNLAKDDLLFNYSAPLDTRQSCICSSGVSLIAISNTLGDIVTIKDISNRIARTSSTDDLNELGLSSESINSSASNNTRNSSDDNKEEVSISSILYCHTINGDLIGLVNCHSRVTAVCYSSAAEGVSVNVIVVGLAEGLIRLYSSWDLTRVKEFHVSGIATPITSLIYSRDNQLLYVAYEDGQMVTLSNKKKLTLPKEWVL